MIEYAVHNGSVADTQRQQVWGLYDAVFGDYSDQEEWRRGMWDRHRAREGFCLATAYDGSTLVGFAWGYVGERGQYWPDLVTERLPAVAEAWVGGHWEFVELAVSCDQRGAGIGARLHDTIIDHAGERRALLGANADVRDPAVQLYLSRAWRHLGLLDADTQLMGRMPTG